VRDRAHESAIMTLAEGHPGGQGGRFAMFLAPRWLPFGSHGETYIRKWWALLDLNQ
jgi:hypothetical protein